MIREAEAKEQAKRVQKEIARQKTTHAAPDKMKSISSADFQTSSEKASHQ
jgi:hypothetical protein